jgi:hypothetical protein
MAAWLGRGNTTGISCCVAFLRRYLCLDDLGITCIFVKNFSSLPAVGYDKIFLTIDPAPSMRKQKIGEQNCFPLLLDGSGAQSNRSRRPALRNIAACTEVSVVTVTWAHQTGQPGPTKATPLQNTAANTTRKADLARLPVQRPPTWKSGSIHPSQHRRSASSLHRRRPAPECHDTTGGSWSRLSDFKILD